MSGSGKPKPPPRQPRRQHNVPKNDNLPKPTSFDEYDESYYNGEDTSFVYENAPLSSGSASGSLMATNSVVKPKTILDDVPETTIGGAVKMKGELAFTTLLRVDGEFEGTLISEGSLIIGKAGKVVGDVKGMKEIIVDGKIVGDIDVEKVAVRGKGIIYGAVTCKSFTCESDCVVVGALNVNPFAPSKIDSDCNVITEMPVVEPMPTDIPDPEPKKVVKEEEKNTTDTTEAPKTDKTDENKNEAPKENEVPTEPKVTTENPEAPPKVA